MKLESIRKQEESPGQMVFLQQTMNSYKSALLSHKSMTDMLRKAQMQLKKEKEWAIDNLEETKQMSDPSTDLHDEKNQLLRDNKAIKTEVENIKEEVEAKMKNLEEKHKVFMDMKAKEEEMQIQIDRLDDPEEMKKKLMKQLGIDGTPMFQSDGPEFSIRDDYIDKDFEGHEAGWGSNKKGTLDPETGKLAKITRNPSMKDYWEAAGYLNFLEAQFQVQDDEIEHAYTDTEEYGVDMVKDQQTFEQIIKDVEEISTLISKNKEEQLALNDPEIMIKNLTKLNEKVKNMHQNIYNYNLEDQ